ncbi:MAG: D-hexose-6-phosphate mutarotase [Bacteroidota bacterium]
MTTAQLNQKFGIEGKIFFSDGKGNLPEVTITNEYAAAVISLYGAHVISYQPTEQKNILWMSEQSAFETGKPIRGGVPVCFPWFGPHESDNQKPQHGFARLSLWNVKDTSVLADNSLQIQLELQSNDETKKLWPFDFIAIITVIVGKKLSIALTVKNTGSEKLTYTDALHSYFNISDLSNILIEGLHNATYYSSTSTDLITQQDELLAITKEENRRYVNHTKNCIIHDSGFERKILVSKANSNVTVVWNPGEQTTKNIPDISDSGYKTFICVEAVNAYKDINIITVQPGNEYTMSTSFELI